MRHYTNNTHVELSTSIFEVDISPDLTIKLKKICNLQHLAIAVSLRTKPLNCLINYAIKTHNKN